MHIYLAVDEGGRGGNDWKCGLIFRVDDEPAHEDLEGDNINVWPYIQLVCVSLEALMTTILSPYKFGLEF